MRFLGFGFASVGCLGFGCALAGVWKDRSNKGADSLFPLGIAHNINIRPATLPAEPGDHVRGVFLVVMLQEIARIGQLNEFFSCFEFFAALHATALPHASIAQQACTAVYPKAFSKGAQWQPS